MMKDKIIQVSAPGRVCLFGEHQDYLKLSVIPAAINFRCHIRGSITNDSKIKLDDRVFREKIVIPFGKKQKQSPFKIGINDYFKAVINVLIKKGYFKDFSENNYSIGFKGELWNDVPQKSGLSSSAAVLVTFVKLFDVIFQLNLDEIEIGYLAYLAEHDEMGIPCGQMDQLAASIGNIFHMKCVEPPIVTKIKNKIPGLVVGNTLIPKSTNSVHSIRVKEINDAINYLKSKIDFDIEKTTLEEVEPYLKDVNEIWLKRMRATLMDRDITNEAYKELNKNSPDLQYLGHLLNEHQRYLRDDYEVSVEKIEKMLKAGVEAGALGGKLTGAGMGGSIIMLAPNKQKEVAEALTKAGGKGYIVEIDEGARIDKI
ncbi:MAG: GHMP family kinase ATP-binding protein [Promethearchaeota archaeon]